MMFEAPRPVALVTGASRGIGKAIATRLSAEGAVVAICARPNPGAADLGTLEQARAELEQLGPVLAVPFDLGDASLDRAGWLRSVEAELGPIDILVNNAAAGGYRPFLEWTDEQIERVIELNVRVPWQLTRLVLPGMLQRGRGAIVNISSQAAELPAGPPFLQSHPAQRGTVYGGSKAFLNRWTVSLAAEVHGRGIAVNSLAPQAAAATEVLVTYSDIADYLYEPLETMAEACLSLCDGDPDVVTGKVAYSLELLVELERPVRDLHGSALLDGWQPTDLPARIARMRAHIGGEIGTRETNVDRIMDTRRKDRA
jgi:NAD(P)-dependent dehydrogenase (short-subunit alcohol dehydrogenase family)